MKTIKSTQNESQSACSGETAHTALQSMKYLPELRY